MMRPKVSMVVACYNKESYISAMLASVRNQKWDNVEVILVNDGSTDGTRSIIAEWVPKLEARGYEVILIDRENGGICAALYDGLTRMTGEYFCVPDCDDWLHPEYVSGLAEFLYQNLDYEYVTCNHEIVKTKDPAAKPIPQRGFTTFPSPNQFMTKLLLRNTLMPVWGYMIRKSYADNCGLIRNFCTERRHTQEPLIFVPLATGGGKGYLLDKPLYRYYTTRGGLFGFKSFDEIVRHDEDYCYLLRWAIERTKLSDAEKEHYYRLIGFTLLRMHMMSLASIPNAESYRDTLGSHMSRWVDSFLTPSPRLGAERIWQAGGPALAQAMDECIHGPCPVSKAFMDNQRRVIAYGALGQSAKKRLPLLKGSPMEPDILWDIGAGDGKCGGAPVSLPDFSTLSEKDIMLVFPRDPNVLSHVRQEASRSGALVLDVARAMTDTSIYWFPSIYTAKPQPKVSMVVPCYNKESYITSMLESVQEQIWGNLEIILVNDGSTDGTRDIIAKWAPKLEACGYTVVVVNQNNQGTPLSIKNGLAHATGEFICFVDCDDKIKPEYVSTMAEQLTTHPELDWVDCDYERVSWDPQYAAQYDGQVHVNPDETHKIERFLLRRRSWASWIFMVRKEYLERCRVADCLNSPIRQTQEPSIILPILSGGGNSSHIDGALYVYHFFPESQEHSLHDQNRAQRIVSDLHRAARWVLENMSIDESHRRWYLAVQALAELKCRWRFADDNDLPTIAKAAANFANTELSCEPAITTEQVLFAGLPLFFRTIERVMLDEVEEEPEVPIDRIIGYGALGRIAQSRLAKLVNTPYMPTLLWDKAAKPGDSFGGVAITLPDFEALRPDDTLFVFPKAPAVLEETRRAAAKRGVTAILDHVDIMDLLAAVHFPQVALPNSLQEGNNP